MLTRSPVLELEREDAMREVLTVLNHYQGDEVVVFNSILDKCLQLCAAQFEAYFLNEVGDTHQNVVATRGGSFMRMDRFANDPTPLDPALNMSVF